VGDVGRTDGNGWRAGGGVPELREGFRPARIFRLSLEDPAADMLDYPPEVPEPTEAWCSLLTTFLAPEPGAEAAARGLHLAAMERRGRPGLGDVGHGGRGGPGPRSPRARGGPTLSEGSGDGPAYLWAIARKPR
jgi:hypothetical protein